MAPRSVRVCKGEKKGEGVGGRRAEYVGYEFFTISTKSLLRCCLLPFFSLRTEPCPTLASSWQLLGGLLPTGVGQKATLLTAGGGDTGGGGRLVSRPR